MTQQQITAPETTPPWIEGALEFEQFAEDLGGDLEEYEALEALGFYEDAEELKIQKRKEDEELEQALIM